MVYTAKRGMWHTTTSHYQSQKYPEGADTPSCKALPNLQRTRDEAPKENTQAKAPIDHTTKQRHANTNTQTNLQNSHCSAYTVKTAHKAKHYLTNKTPTHKAKHYLTYEAQAPYKQPLYTPQHTGRHTRTAIVHPQNTDT